MELLSELNRLLKDESTNPVTGDVMKYKVPSIPELLNRIEKLEELVESLMDKMSDYTGDFYKAQKVLKNPGRVTWENVEAYQKRLTDWNEYGPSQSTTLS